MYTKRSPVEIQATTYCTLIDGSMTVQPLVLWPSSILLIALSIAQGQI
jgi:hypothetical protein